MNTKAKIAYIILTWNSDKYIKKCLDSILENNNFINNIIIIDNGSKDSTVDIIKEYKKENQNIKLILLDTNVGTTKSRNLGLKLIKDDTNYICILDSDTVINNDALTGLIEQLQNDSNIGIIGPKLKNSKNEVQLSGRKFPNLKIKLCKAIPIKKIQKIGENAEKYRFINGLNKVDYLISAFWLMRYDTFQKIGFFDEKIFYAPEDVDYCMRIYKNDLKCVFYPNVEIIHEYQRISKKKLFSKMNWEHIKGLVYYFKKYNYIFNPYK